LVQRPAALCGEQTLYYYDVQNGLEGRNYYNYQKSIFKCPTAIIDQSVKLVDRIAFQYGMNSKGLDQMPPSVTNLKTPMIASPSKFALFTEGRTLTTETPFGQCSKGIRYLQAPGLYHRFLVPAQRGASITFADGHTKWYKYYYVISTNTPGKAGDPAGRTSNGLPTAIRCPDIIPSGGSIPWLAGRRFQSQRRRHLNCASVRRV